jgi:hypothetical protein
MLKIGNKENPKIIFIFCFLILNSTRMFKNKNALNVCRFSARAFRQRILLCFAFISTGKLVLNYAGFSGTRTWHKMRPPTSHFRKSHFNAGLRAEERKTSLAVHRKMMSPVPK